MVDHLGSVLNILQEGANARKYLTVGSADVEELETDHEETNSKIAHLIQHAERSSYGQQIICAVRSSSSDIDIPITLLGMDLENNV